MNSSVKMIKHIKRLFKGRMQTDKQPTIEELHQEYQNAALALVARMRGVTIANQEIQALAQRLNELASAIQKVQQDGKDTSSKKE